MRLSLPQPLPSRGCGEWAPSFPWRERSHWPSKACWRAAWVQWRRPVSAPPRTTTSWDIAPSLHLPYSWVSHVWARCSICDQTWQIPQHIRFVADELHESLFRLSKSDFYSIVTILVSEMTVMDTSPLLFSETIEEKGLEHRGGHLPLTLALET